MPARNFSLLEVVQELYSVVGCFPPAGGLQDAHTGRTLALAAVDSHSFISTWSLQMFLLKHRNQKITSDRL